MRKNVAHYSGNDNTRQHDYGTTKQGRTPSVNKNKRLAEIVRRKNRDYAK
jgi:hypothetical protein